MGSLETCTHVIPIPESHKILVLILYGYVHLLYFFMQIFIIILVLVLYGYVHIFIFYA